MNLKEKKDFCWAARHTLMDLVALEVYKVHDKIGVVNFIEKMSDPVLTEVTISCLNMIDGDQEVYLNEMYNRHLKNSNPKLSIQDSTKWLNGRDDYLTEASEKEMSPEQIAQLATNVSLKAAVSAMAVLYFKNPSKGRVAAKHLIRQFGIDALRLIRRYPAVEKGVMPAIKTVKGVDQILQGKQKIDFSKVSSAGKKAAIGTAIAGGITAASLLAYGIYKKLTDPASRSCSSKSGIDKKECILRFKINAANEAIKVLEKAMGGCDQKEDPVKCKYSFNRKIWYWNKRKQKYQEQMSKLAQKKNQFRIHKKLN